MIDLDLYRYQKLDEVFDPQRIITYRNLNLVTIIIFLLSKISWITIEIVRFIFVFIGSQIVLHVFSSKYVQSHISHLSRLYKFKLFIIALLTIPVYYISFGFRSGLGACVMMAAIIQLIQKRKSGYLLLIISSMIHFSYFAFSGIYLLGYFYHKRIVSKDLIKLLVIFLTITLLVIIISYNRMPFITMILDVYMFGEYGTNFAWNAYTLKEVILINGIPTIIFYYLFLTSEKKRTNLRFSNILFMNLAIFIIFLPFYSIFQRIGVVSILLLAIYSILYTGEMKIFRYYKPLVISLIISFIFPFFMHRYIYYHSHIEMFPFSSLPIIFQNTYSEEEIYNLLDEDGILKKQYIK